MLLRVGGHMPFLDDKEKAALALAAAVALLKDQQISDMYMIGHNSFLAQKKWLISLCYSAYQYAKASGYYVS